MRTIRQLRPLVALALLAPLAPAAAQLDQPLDSTTLAAFRWRNIGPANMMGRVTDIEGVPGTKTFYVAAAAGGIWKTTNNGTTFTPVFDRERVISMGDMAIAPSDPNVLYAGTGEEDSRNSISPGGGVYKSTDGGRTWRLTGLEATQQIGRILVHPTDPNTAYVAALGHAWGPNPERGVYKTTDGGTSWRLVKFISDRAGFVDLQMDPRDPNVLYASAWERVRGPYSLKSGGPGSGLWKTTDGGATWTELRSGLPTTTLGRIGLAIAPSNPDVVYALVEADSLPNPQRGAAYRPQPGEQTYGTGGQGGTGYPIAKAQSGLFRSNDGGRTWTRQNRENNRPFYYSRIWVDPRNENRVYWLSTNFQFSDDAGKTFRRGALGIHVDFHAFWVDPRDPDHFIVGSDGGIAQTWDRGGTYDYLNQFAIGQFYNISYDMQKPYRVCGGLQDNGSWCGPSRTRGTPITNADWFNVGGGDGFHTAQDPDDPNIIYSESQGGNIGRFDVASGMRTPVRSGFGFLRRRTAMEDSVVLVRPDTAKPETPEQARRIADLRARFRAESLAQLRFNWNTPFFLSPHSGAVLYIGGNRVLKSTNRGQTLVPISPDLSTQDSAAIRISTTSTGGVTPDVTGAETFGTIVSLAESRTRPGLLFAGTDDGNVWLSRNDGGSWESLTGRFPGVPRGTYVSRIEPSGFDSATVYVTFDNHRRNDFTPYVYVSNDFGRTFRSIAATLPTGAPDFVHVIREDPTNRSLLYLGTDVGAYVSTNGGRSWQRFMTGLPTVPVTDLKIHPRERELIAATHGRAIWIVDVAPLQDMVSGGATVASADAYLFPPKTAYQFQAAGGGGGGGTGEGGNKRFAAQVPAYGAEIVYRLAGGSPADSARIVITDVSGDTVRVLRGEGGPGIHRVVWNLRGNPPALTPSGVRDSILLARRREFVRDSTRRARGADSARAGGDSARVIPGEGGRGGRGARGGADAPNERPAEAAAPAGGAGEGGEGGGGGGGGGFGRGFRQGNNVKPGSYLVTLVANGHTLRRVLDVERIGDVTDATPFEEEDDPEHEP
ncbi:MAG: VPS10 domain-containing protein [Gemmatimonadaceae bacterium]